MHEQLTQLISDLPLTGDVQENATAFLHRHGYPHTAKHSAWVAAEARRLAFTVGADPVAAATAGWLHDVSVVFPDSERIRVAEELGIEILPAERAAPMILHQKISAVMAQVLFEIEDAAVLSAIRCHTTLKTKPSQLDKVVFLADKIRWDQPGHPPYVHNLIVALTHSLDRAILCHLEYLWKRRHTLAVVHPWFEAAYRQFSATTAG
jgi:predicted HD superfamily hydrolase involved in NAD metabolism